MTDAKSTYVKPHIMLWLVLPLVAIISQLMAELFLPRQILTDLHNENGLHEVLQFVLMLLSFLVATFSLIKYGKAMSWLYRGWFALAALCCLYVGGEEISWGQHFFGWETSEGWKEINDQQETNFHNTSSWLDQKPRLLLLVGITLGGLILPFTKNLTQKLIPDFAKPLMPIKYMAFIAALPITINLSEKLVESFLDKVIFARGSEVEELFLYYFVFVYLLDLKSRLFLQNKR